MKILVWSDLPMPSGFGRISVAIARGLAQRGHQVNAASLMYQYGPTNEPYYIWSVAPPRDLWATTVDVINRIKPDVIVSVQDFPYHHTLYWGCRIDFSTIAWVVITPIDGTPVDEEWVKLAKIPDGFMVISKFGVEAMRQVGVHADLCEPGIDFGEFHPATLEEKKELRRKAGLPEDAFIVMSAMMNQGRKNCPGTMEAFKTFCVDKPNALLYMDMEKASGAGWDLGKLARQIGLDEKRIRYKADIAPHLPMLGDRYRMADVHSLLSFREGCFVEGTLVHTKRGYVPIEHILTSDHVMSHTGQWQNVSKTMARPYTGTTVTVYPFGDARGITCTAEHPWLVKRDNVVEWVKAEDIQPNDMLCMPKPKITNIGKTLETKQYAITKKAYNLGQIELTEDMARFFGYYVSEGSVNSNNRSDVRFSFNRKEQTCHDFIGKMFDFLGIRTYLVEKPACTQICTSSVELSRLLADHFGKGAGNKRIPDWMFNAPIEFVIPFIAAMWEGDGCFFVDHDKYMSGDYTTISKSLAYGLRTLLGRLGVFASIYIPKGNHSGISLRVQGEQAAWLSKLLDEPIYSHNKRDRVYHCFDEDYCYVLVRKTEKLFVEDIPVYNMSVEEDESYTVYGYAVHNCGLPGRESMATGIPSIMQDWCAGTETCGDGKGCLVPIAKYANGKPVMQRGTWGGAFDAFPDLDEYVNILNRLYSDEGYRLSVAKKGYEWAKTLTWEQTANQVEETIMKAVRKKKALPQPVAPREFVWTEPKSDTAGPGSDG